MNGDIVRPITYADVDRIAELEKICFITPWSREAIAGELKNSAAHYLVLERNGRVEAYVGMWIIIDEIHITNIAVAPECRRQGLGKRLMLCAMEHGLLFGATCMTLEVREHNFGAQAMYAGLDFEKAGVRKGYYYDTGESAYILWNRDIALTLEKQRASIKEIKPQGEIL